MDVDLRLLKEGNERVFRQIVRSYECRLNRFAMIYTQNRAVSEEIVSDTFLSLWKNRHSLDENTRLTPYLMVILRNKCINYLRSFRHKFVSIDEMDIGAIYVKAHLYTLENDASKLLEEEDLLLVIRKAMETLPEKTRAIFEMSRIQGLKNKEIADQYGLSVKAIEFHITKALQYLRKKMPKEYLFLLFFLFSSYRH
ncbi:RNA polymerase sigma-70 factor [Tannerella sp.]|uniref:RNA polymerase sigma-70 factor n=1 Tax=Tannerella sp. TaxID=2382127 RepID=UPI0026DB4870|nr:RNA polymerase sigma-70 factor [Tannerella sp.]MDO4703031.1 RNA polymerase sigma-70 factor [Tannerella sp.]